MKGGKTRKITAWLVTWEWCGDHAKRDDKVAAIFNARLSSERVREHVEFIYLSAMYSLTERAEYARDNKLNPYPARFGTLDGVTWKGKIRCGHNPELRARLVEDFAVERDEQGKEIAHWEERPKPQTAWIRGEQSRECLGPSQITIGYDRVRLQRHPACHDLPASCIGRCLSSRCRPAKAPRPFSAWAANRP